MKTISEAAKILNIESDKLRKIIKNEGFVLTKGIRANIAHLTEHQLSFLIEKYKVEYIYLESKMNQPELLNEAPPIYSKQKMIEQGFIIPKKKFQSTGRD